MPNLAESTLKRLVALEPFPQPPVVPVRYPIVLMHGFGLLASFRRGGHLHEEALYLRRHGIRAYAPNVTPYNCASVRAPIWKERIEHVLSETGATRVNLIGHSMGGLDARYLVSRLGMHEVVASIVTVSTPHHGSGAASLALEQPERLRDWLAERVNWIGTNTLEEATSDVLRALAELVPSYVCDTFNLEMPDHPAVRYWSFAGRAGKGTDVPINPFLRIQNRLLYAREGVNDGLVSVESARWGTFLGTIDADHMHQVGIKLFNGRAFDAKAFYLSIARMLAEEGF